VRLSGNETVGGIEDFVGGKFCARGGRGFFGGKKQGSESQGKVNYLEGFGWEVRV